MTFKERNLVSNMMNMMTSFLRNCGNDLTHSRVFFLMRATGCNTVTVLLSLKRNDG